MATTRNRERDGQLLEAWRGGDKQAGKQLFLAHGNAVARFFENKVRSGASDLTQQTFLALIESRDRIREGTSVRAYLLATAYNILRDHIRKRGREVDIGVESMAGLEPGPSTVLARKREQRLLLEGLRRIPIEHQVLLELYYWEELNAAELAAIVDISHSAMRSRLSKARKVLCEAIAELASSEPELASTLGGLERWAADLRGSDKS
jgi:RNA polymerase sigma-70 factor (ECF subfamily)